MKYSDREIRLWKFGRHRTHRPDRS